MNAILDKALQMISRLPETEQERIARELIAGIEADQRWEKLFSDPRSKSAMRRLAEEARADIARGDVLDTAPTGRR